MTKNQALALVGQLETHAMPCNVSLRYDAVGGEVWSVQLDATRVYSGAELSALATYCGNNNLTLSAQFESIGVT